MAVPQGLTGAQILANVQATLRQVREALTNAADLGKWAASTSQADLVAAGMDAATATMVLTACADAAAHAGLYNPPGALPAGYTLPYPFGNSQRLVIGP